jgi:hypothetical protein
MYLTSSDLELTTDGSMVQTDGMRWALAVPKGAVITAAWIQFAAKESQSVATNLTFRAQATDNAPAFASAAYNLSSRPVTTAAMAWSPVPWTAGEWGPNQRTPDLGAVIQEVVSRAGWASGNDIVILVTGTGHRTAWAADGNAAEAALLHVEYTPPAGTAMAREARSEDAPPALPTHLAFSEARPNPATGPVSFRLELPRATSVRWGIYDLLGRAIWSEEREFAAGATDLSWSGRTAEGQRAGSGLYFVRLVADNRVLIRRLVRL